MSVIIKFVELQLCVYSNIDYKLFIRNADIISTWLAAIITA